MQIIKMLTAETHEPRKGDGERHEPGDRNFDHRLQDERGSGTVQMRNGDWGAYSALIPALHAATVSPRRRWSARVLRTAITGDCKMHEIMDRRSGCGTAVDQAEHVN